METMNRLEHGMTNANRVCAECGATVFADAPQGICSVCLFRTGLASDDAGAFEPTVARMLKDFVITNCSKKSDAVARAWFIGHDKKV
jgi:hypothetical protein